MTKRRMKTKQANRNQVNLKITVFFLVVHRNIIVQNAQHMGKLVLNTKRKTAKSSEVLKNLAFLNLTYQDI